jgi:glucose/mannose transport system substrate-binding protein
MKKFAVAATLAAALMCSAAPQAAELEVTHWWTSGGESAAVAEFARLFDATGNKWVDSALAGSGTGANPVIISRILGGNPMGATQMNTGRDAEELIKAGLIIRSDPDCRGRWLGRFLCRSQAARRLHL